ncbi:MAG: hypothetical protein AB7I42_29340 [Bradyrhizobium sp.]|uniref:hypothetical protein n=1 Tax=Bradyrhizobium sp. TaxID=376 RepID=UPI003D119C3D
MADKIPELDKLIGHRGGERVLHRDGIAAELALIQRAFEVAGEKKSSKNQGQAQRKAAESVPNAGHFRAAGIRTGTHLLKLISTRAEDGEHVLRVHADGANQSPAMGPSINPNQGLTFQAGKLIFRPLNVDGHAPRALVDHILNPDDLSPAVTAAFAKVFGHDSLDALRESLTSPLPEITTLPAAEFPIIYLPRPGGGDLQVTPIAPAEAYIRFRDDVTKSVRGRWHRQVVTTKQQNISSAVGQKRTRFLATMPRVFDRYSAELHRCAHGGRFPRWRDERVAEAVAGYAGLLDRSSGRTSDGHDPSKAYSNADIRRGLDERADQLIEAAIAFVEEALGDLEREYPEKQRSEKPSLVSIILNRRWPKQDEFDRARRVLSSDHFKGRLKAARG